MMPTERAIQSRIKEAFDFKPTSLQWENLIEGSKVYSLQKHHHTKSAPEKTSFSLFSNIHKENSSKIPEFVMSSVIDPVTNLKTHLVYPKGEE